MFNNPPTTMDVWETFHLDEEIFHPSIDDRALQIVIEYDLHEFSAAIYIAETIDLIFQLQQEFHSV